jgi:hypothetical protein
MRWAVFAIAVLAAVAFDTSLARVLELGGVQPHALPAVLVFTLFSIPRRLALRAAVLAGLVADLLAPVIQSDGTVLVVPGPRILGFALGAFALLQLRGILYRQNPLAGAFATFAFGAAVAVTYGFAWSVRALLLGTSTPWWPSTGAAEAMHGLLVATVDGVFAVPLLWFLHRTRPAWGFVSSTRVTTGLAREGT